MSGEKDTAAHKSIGPAQRTYESLLTARGGVRSEGEHEGAVVVSIQPMDQRTYWLHVTGPKWNSKASMYRQIDAPQGRKP